MNDGGGVLQSTSYIVLVFDRNIKVGRGSDFNYNSVGTLERVKGCYMGERGGDGIILVF